MSWMDVESRMFTARGLIRTVLELHLYLRCELVILLERQRKKTFQARQEFRGEAFVCGRNRIMMGHSVPTFSVAPNFSRLPSPRLLPPRARRCDVLPLHPFRCPRFSFCPARFVSKRMQSTVYSCYLQRAFDRPRGNCCSVGECSTWG